MSTSEQINELATALAAAQGEMKNATLNKTAKVKGTSKRTGKDYEMEYRYADLATIRDAILPILSKHGLSVVQITEVVQAGMLLNTRLLHASGQWIESSYPLAVDFTQPQAIGSAISYGRRYCLTAMCGIASEEDDDGARAEDHRPSGSGNGGARPPLDDTRFVYERLVNTMRSTKSLDALADWKKRTQEEVNALPPEWYDRLTVVYHETKAKLPAPTTKLSERAIEIDRPPLPDDEIPI